MPEDFFKTSGKGGTHTKACLLTFIRTKPARNEKVHHIFMAEAKWCGHDSRGRKINRDDLPLIFDNYLRLQDGSLDKQSHLGYKVASSQLINNILSPRYYNPELNKELTNLEATHDLVMLGKLVEDKVLSIQTGNEVGKLAYGTGTIPFVRTSDISNWEIKIDP